MKEKTPKIFFSAGEASGDQHTAEMFLELKKMHPSIQGLGMGSQNMQQAGIDVRFDSRHIAVIGLFEVLTHYVEIRRALKSMQQLLLAEKPDLLICIDYKEFNLKLAQFAKKKGIKVLFYVSPQVWAWRAGRVITYGKAIDRMAVIFPFETSYYEAENIPVTYVGHPSVNKVKPNQSIAENKKRFHLNSDYHTIGLLAGSRANEIKHLLPVMLASAERLSAKYKNIQFILPQADSIDDELLQNYLTQSAIDITVIKNEPYDVIQCCDAIITCSGTASLEVALLQIPMVIVYKLSPLTYFIGKHLIHTPFIGLPNIIAGKSIIKELIQHDMTAQKLSTEVEQLLFNQSYRTTLLTELAQVKEKLGDGGGSKNMADLALKMCLKN